MAVKEYAFKYGRGEMRFHLESADVNGELTIKDYPPLQDPAAAIRDAIRNPIQSKPLREIVKPGPDGLLYRQRPDPRGQQPCLYAHSA